MTQDFLKEAREAMQERLVQAQDDNRRLREHNGTFRGSIIVALDQLKGTEPGDPIATLEDALRETEGSP